MTKIDSTKIIRIVLAQNKLETNIKEYKVFYKTHLCHIKDRSIVLSKLYNLCIKFQKATPISPFISNTDRNKLEAETEKILKEYFNKSIFELFNKIIPTPEPKIKIPNPDNKFLIELFENLSNTLETSTKQFKQEWHYKTNFLFFLNDCLFNFGLHPNILKRDPKIYKRYNLVIDHHYRSPKNKQTEYKLFMTPDTLENEFSLPYEKQLPIKISGKLIPFKSIYQINITSTLLLEDEIELFAAKNEFQWNSKNKDITTLISLCKDETEELHNNPFLVNQEKEKFRSKSTYFVNPSRIKELKNIKSEKFDLLKLIQLCEELNNASSTMTAYTPTLLVRSIIDYTPPIFGFRKFSQVANNYVYGTKSFKKSMLILDNSLRNIADNNIHSQARQKEILPTSSQSDFTPELDLLLSEIIRILK